MYPTLTESSAPGKVMDGAGLCVQDTALGGVGLCVVDTALPLCCRKSAGARERRRLPQVPMQISYNTFTGFCASGAGGWTATR